MPAAEIGMAELAYYLPSRRRSLEELHRDGLLTGSPETLATFGFQYAHVTDGESNLDMAVEAARRVLHQSAVDPSEIGLLLYATALTSSATMAADSAAARGAVLRLDSVAECFQYPASCLQAELELTRAAVAGVDQQGCASLMSALRIGRAMLSAEQELGTVLCVSADVFPAGQPRDLVYNVISDGACAVLLARGARNRILSCAQVTKGSYWDAAAIEHEVIAAYFPTAKNLITSALASAGLSLDDIALVIPHNVSRRSWDILCGLLNLPEDRVYTDNIARVGHTIASDNILNLRDAIDGGRVAPGDKLLLFTFGFGLNWSCMVVEH
ncbi:MAG: 3-oxoacyl-[acyl-carrier-protein] synthase III C-terminal domain-containing protein [Gemmatimonadaceae bacterium]